MQEFDIALIVTIEADSYEKALLEAEDMAEGIGMTEEISCSAVIYYEHDNEGRRVLYLHPENPKLVL